MNHALEALRFAADLPCKPSNCGTVCLCGPCHARRAIFGCDPDRRPRYTKNFFASGRDFRKRPEPGDRNRPVGARAPARPAAGEV